MYSLHQNKKWNEDLVRHQMVSGKVGSIERMKVNTNKMKLMTKMPNLCSNNFEDPRDRNFPYHSSV